MARKCALCGKRHQVGHLVSHAHNRTKRLFKPNLQTVRTLIGHVVTRIRVCTACIRSGRVIKPV